MLTVGQECSSFVEVDGSDKVWAVTFGGNGEYLVSGNDEGLRVWQVPDGKQIAMTKACQEVQCVAISKDGGWIAAGTFWGNVIVWDAKTYKKTFALENALEEDHHTTTNRVDFSPDVTRLLVASQDCTATVWDIATRERVLTLRHQDTVIAAKYSPQGDRIATATCNFVLVYDSNDGRLLVLIRVKVTPWYNTGLVWLNNHLLVLSDNEIKRIDASTGSVVSEWPVPDTNTNSCIALPRHGEFITYSTNRTIVFWDTLTHTQFDLIQHPQDIYSIALSPDDQFLAIGGEHGKTATTRLSRITANIASC